MNSFKGAPRSGGKRDFTARKEGFKPKGGPRKDSLRETICIRRVSKTVSRGRVRSVSACVVVGDGRGRVGLRVASAKETQDALRKATQAAESRMKLFPIWNKRTLPHDIEGSFGAVKVIARKAPSGTGIIAGSVMRMIFESMGIKDVVAKVVCGRNPINIGLALLNALDGLRTPAQIAAQRATQSATVTNELEGVEA